MTGVNKAPRMCERNRVGARVQTATGGDASSHVHMTQQSGHRLTVSQNSHCSTKLGGHRVGATVLFSHLHKSLWLVQLYIPTTQWQPRPHVTSLKPQPSLRWFCSHIVTLTTREHLLRMAYLIPPELTHAPTFNPPHATLPE